MQLWMIWIIAAIIFAVIEIYTPSFFIIWFSVGSLASAFTCIFTDNPIIQFIVFIGISTVLILSTKKLSDRMIIRGQTIKTNTDTLIGSEAIVIDTIEPLKGKGRIKLNGSYWKATTNNNLVIEKDSEVIIQNITGVTALVEPKHK